jgi:hypothetical protein
MTATEVSRREEIAMAEAKAIQMKLEDELKKLMISPHMTVGPPTTSTDALLMKRVKELEGYMPILLDKLEKQDEKIDDLNDRFDRAMELLKPCG